MIHTSNACQLTPRFSKGVLENILHQHNLFVILESSETIAQLRLCSIFFLTIIVPMRWLASNTFKLSHRNWGEKSMEQVINLIYDAFVAIQADGSLIIDYDFMMGIFEELQSELPEFNTYMTGTLRRRNATLLDHQARLSMSSQLTRERKCYFIQQKGRTCKPMSCVQHWQLGWHRA
jgi:hypothetical protein